MNLDTVVKVFKSESSDFKHSLPYYRQFVKRHCRKRPDTVYSINSVEPSSIDSLNSYQSEVYKYCEELLVKRENNRIGIYGVAGTGKTFLVLKIKKLFESEGRSVQIVCPTGFLASNFGEGKEGAVTLHHFLCLTKYNNITELCERNSVSPTFINKAKNLDLLVIDECSMVNSTQFYYVNLCLRIAKGVDLPFGGISVIILYDLHQLRPVAGQSIFCVNVIADESDYGYLGIGLFNEFKTFHLLSQQRQKNDFVFQKLLHDIRRRCIDDEGLMLLNSRCKGKLSCDEVALFDNSLTICQTRLAVLFYNNEHLSLLNKPILTIKPEFHPRSHYYFREKSNSLQVTIGCKVVLNENISIPFRLCNGSVGYVTGVLFNDANQATVILVRFEGSTFQTVEKDSIPIVAFEESFYDVNAREAFSIKYFPLELFFSSTVFKVQGQSLESACVLLGENEVWAGGTYTALSRVSRLENLMILDECVKKERINGPINSLHREEDESRQIGVYDYIYSPLTHTTKDQAEKSIMVCVCVFVV
jgi:ATP-dependent DNA helicase PIF1